MKPITIQANSKYTITQHSDGEVIVLRNGGKIAISDPDIIIRLALTIRDLMEIIEIYKDDRNSYV